MLVKGSHTWSHYYGNFDQDNTTVGNDADIFIGSSTWPTAPGASCGTTKRATPR